jgi:hypothetical protein
VGKNENLKRNNISTRLLHTVEVLVNTQKDSRMNSIIPCLFYIVLSVFHRDLLRRLSVLVKEDLTPD